MAKRKDKETTKFLVVHEGDVMITPEGYRIMGVNYYIRMAKAAMDERAWCTAWGAWGSALAHMVDPAEAWDMRQLEKKSYKLMLNRRGDRKKDKDKRRKRTEYA